MSYVQINYKGQSFNLISNLNSLNDLNHSFRYIAGIPQTVAQITFIYADPISGFKNVILSDADLQTIKAISAKSSQQLKNTIVNLTAACEEENNDDLPEIVRNDSSDTEVVENLSQTVAKAEQPVADTTEKQKKSVKFNFENDLIEDSQKVNKPKKNKEKVKKLIAKELEKRLPSIVDSAKALVLEQLKQKCPAARAATLSAPAPSNPQNDVQHRYVTCDGCGAHPIIGVRYKCVTCQDYDLCETCEEKGVHVQHAFVKIRKPELAPKMLVTVETDQEAQDMIDSMPADQKHRVLDIDFNTLFGCFNSNKPNPTTSSEAKKEKKQKCKSQKKARKQEARELEAQQLQAAYEESMKSVSRNEIVAAVVGGSPSQYVEICEVLSDSTPEEIIQYIYENNLFMESRIRPAVVVATAAEVQVASTPSGDAVNTTTVSNSTAVSTPTGCIDSISSSTPQPSENDQQDSSVVISKLIASILDDNETLYEKYLVLVKSNADKSIDEILYIAMTNPLLSEVAPAVAVVEKAPVVQDQAPIVKEEQAPLPVVEKSYPTALKKKAEQVAEIMGGSYTDYIDGILNLPCKASVQQIIESILSQPAVVEQPKVEKKKEAEVAVAVVPSKPKRVLRKKYSLLIQKKASEVAAVLGGEPDIYYGMIDTYCLSTVNELIELVLNQPDLITNLSSFKNE